MKALEQSEVWFVAGSQGLYGSEALRQVEEHAREIAASLDAEGAVPVRVVQKGVATSPEAILAVMREANASTACVGVVAWMHTF
jgi:L-arabinose isomerase